MEEGLLMRLSEVKRLTGLSKQAIYRLATAGEVRVVKPGCCQKMYVRRSVLAWLERAGVA